MAKFLGLQYPLLKTPRGIMAQKNGVEQIKADLLQLLLTNPGERVMMPTFGTPLRQLIFEPNDSALEATAKQMIANAVLQWEPRIVVQNIEVTSNFAAKDMHPDDPGDEQPAILGIKIEFVDPDNIAQVEKIEMQLPLGG
jgi:phage baseplate assembly protein W